MRYTYSIQDSRGNTVEDQTFSSEEEAHEYINIMRDSGRDTQDWHIVKHEHYTVTGMGRDPDLH